MYYLKKNKNSTLDIFFCNFAKTKYTRTLYKSQIWKEINLEKEKCAYSK